MGSIPASDQPMSEQTMKNMLISLRQTLYSDLSATVSSLANVVQQHDQRLHHVESKMSDFFIAHNDLVNAYTEQEDDMQLIQLKLAYLEDWTCRNNIKLQNISESVQQHDLDCFLQSLICTLIPDLSDRDLVIGRSPNKNKGKTKSKCDAAIISKNL